MYKIRIEKVGIKYQLKRLIDSKKVTNMQVFQFVAFRLTSFGSLKYDRVIKI